jgi:hypothetical protein
MKWHIYLRRLLKLIMETVELKSATVSLRDDGIVHIHIKEGTEMQLGDAIQIVTTIGKLGKEQKLPVLIDCGEFATIDKDVRLFSASADANIYTAAEAVAYHSFAHRLLADFYINHNKPPVPTRVFPDNESAIDWLKKYTKVKA